MIGVIKGDARSLDHSSKWIFKQVCWPIIIHFLGTLGENSPCRA